MARKYGMDADAFEALNDFEAYEVVRRETITIKRLTHQILNEDEAALIKGALGL